MIKAHAKLKEVFETARYTNSTCLPMSQKSDNVPDKHIHMVKEYGLVTFSRFLQKYLNLS